MALAAALASLLLAPGLAAASGGADPALEPGHFAVRRWSVETGLPQSSVTAIVETVDGYLWVGTFGGLARFDGRSFTTIPSGPGAPSVPRVLALHEGPRGTLWVGTEGAGLLVVERNRLVVPRGLDLPRDISVDSVLEEPSGRLWVAAGPRGVFLLEKGSRRSWGAAEGVPGTVAGGLTPRPGGGVLFTIPDAAVELGGEEPASRVIRRASYLYGVLAEPGGSYLAAEVDGGLRRWTGEMVTTLSERDRAKRGFCCLARDRAGRVWASLPARGVFAVEGNRMVPVCPKEVREETFRCLLADREGSLWLGSNGGGLVQLAPASFRMIEKGDGLPDDVVRAVAQDAGGAVWAAVGCSGVARIAGGRVTGLVGADEFPGDSCIFSLCPRRDGSLVASGYVGTLFSVVSGSATPHPASPVPQPTSLLEDGAGVLWAGSRLGGVYRLEGAGKRHFTAADGLPAGPVATLAEDAEGRLLVGTTSGVGVIAGERATALAMTGGLPPRQVRALLPDGRRLWIGSYGEGLSLVFSGRLFRFGPEHGIPENVVSFLHRDEEGFLWWSGNRGVYRARSSDLADVAAGVLEKASVRIFGRADGLSTTETNGGFLPAGWRTREGSLLVPTIRGLAVVDPRSVASPSPPPPVHVEEVLVDGRSVDVRNGLVRVPSSARRLEIRVGAPTFRAPEQVRFWKRLEGFDPAWVDAGAERVATFTRLSPGAYTFAARASLGRGEAGSAGAELRVVVEPGLAETPWFRLLAGALLVVAVASVAWLRTSALRRGNERLTELVRSRTEELEAANSRLAEISETDALTGLTNQRGFTKRFGLAWEAAETTRQPISLVIFDVDHFKRYNDALGHPAGDSCLRRVGAQLSAATYRTSDVVARYGGEEFVVVITGVGEEGAAIAAERVRKAVELLGIPHPDSPAAPTVTVSAGFATARPASGDTQAGLFARADAALYRAKGAGRNRVSA